MIHYTPTTGVSGSDTLQYTATDPYGTTSAPAVVTIAVTPTVAGISATTTVNVATNLSPAAPSGSGPFTWAIGVAPVAGTVTIDASTGAMLFTPAPGASGTVTYTYVATDQYGTASAPATATVRVVPVAWSISTTVPANAGPVAVALPLPSGTGPFTCALVTSSLPPASAASATVNATNCIVTFTAAAGFSGTIDVQYTVTDAAGLTSAPAAVLFDVLAASTTANTDPTSNTPAAPDSGVHLWRQALLGGSLMILGLLLIVATATRRRREEQP